MVNSLGQNAPEPVPPPGFRPIKDAPTKHGSVVILAHRDNCSTDFRGEYDFDVMLARLSTSQCYIAWLSLYQNIDDSGDCNHGAVATPIGWLPLPAA